MHINGQRIIDKQLHKLELILLVIRPYNPSPQSVTERKGRKEVRS